MPPPASSRGREETPEVEQHQVHNCFVVMADMTGIVPEAASNVGASPGASRRSGSRALHDLQGLGSGSPFSMLEGMNPFVFGTFIQSQQDSGLGGVAPSSQSGEQPSAVQVEIRATQCVSRVVNTRSPISCKPEVSCRNSTEPAPP